MIATSQLHGIWLAMARSIIKGGKGELITNMFWKSPIRTYGDRCWCADAVIQMDGMI